jgi:spore germination protein YaaH
VGGYHPWWAGDSWVAYPLTGLNRLYLFEVELSSDGGPGDLHGWPERWAALSAAALDARVSFVPTVTLHPEDAVEALLEDSVAVQRAVRTIADLVRDRPEVDGVHLDLEVFRPVSQAARAGYVALARGVRLELDRIRPGSVLSVFLPALDEADAYDEAGLAAATDYVVVQGYDLHHRTGERAGPVAAIRGWGPLSWEAVVDRLLRLGLDPASLVMGVPLYGYRWPTEGPEPGSPTRGPGVALPLDAPPDVLPELVRAADEARRHGVRRDRESGSPYYVHRDGEGWVQGWFEDLKSLAAKRAFVARRGLGGVAYFPLSYATREIREGLRRR